VGIDVTRGRVTPRAGETTAPVPAEELARRVRDQGARTVIHTDVTRDGTLTGPDVTGARGIALLGLEVVVGGGVGSLGDIGAIRVARLDGAIVGRALHEGRFTLAEALACAVA
jgi:phosphoribosylformimino-5-aminoimidazole carboxamide ribotide isomerase